jgi:NifB/MoaA-like Fe-S oxidoreductase
MLREGTETFLDDLTVSELSVKLGREIIIADMSGEGLIKAVLQCKNQQ